jgi:hypothetical protein
MEGALTEILVTSCAIKNKRALTALVTPIVIGEVVASLRKAEVGLWLQYDAIPGEAVFVVCDGVSAIRCTVTHVSKEGAERILAECRLMVTWSESLFRAAVVKALGATIHTMQ